MSEQYKIYTEKIIKKKLKDALRHPPLPNEICMTYMKDLDIFGFLIIADMNIQMKAWRELAKQKLLRIEIENHRTKTIKGETYYIFVIQSWENGMVTSIDYDLMGMYAFDNGSFIVSGFIYAFKSKINRDRIYEYVMKGLK